MGFDGFSWIFNSPATWCAKCSQLKKFLKSWWLTSAGAAQQSFVEAFSSSYQALLADALKDLEPDARRKFFAEVGRNLWDFNLFQHVSTCFKVDHLKLDVFVLPYQLQISLGEADCPAETHRLHTCDIFLHVCTHTHVCLKWYRIIYIYMCTYTYT